MRAPEALVAAVALGVAAPAAAHGPAPAALEALRVDADGPIVVRTNIGLASHWPERDGYRYVCPSQWGAEDEIPLAAALGDGTLVLGPTTGLFRADPLGCRFERLAVPGWDEHTVFDVVAPGGDGPAYVVARGRGGDSTVWRVGAEGPAEVAAALPDFAVDSGAIDGAGALWMAAASPAPILAVRPPGGGGTIERRPLRGLEADPDFIDLRLLEPPHTPARAFAVAVRRDEARLLEIDLASGEATLLAGPAERIHGPVRLGDGLLALVDGELRHRATVASGPLETGEAIAWTCLRARDGVVIACDRRGLARVTGAPAAPEVRPWFALEAIRGVDPACPADPAMREACTRDWIHFGAEAGLVDPDEVPDGVPGGSDAGPDGGAADAGAPDAAPAGGSDAEPDGGGCASAGRGRGPLAALVLLAVVATRRRHV